MTQLHVEVNGNGPDLVLLHGWGLNVRVWDGLVKELRDRFRMITVDLPGHGRSPWSPGRNTPAEQAWLLHSTLAPISNRYSLLGWSLGGQIALDLAAAMPARVDRLVLVATTPRFTAAPDWPYGMKADAIAKMATHLREDYQQTVRDFLDLQVRGSLEGGSVIEQLRNALFVHGQAKPEALEAGLSTLATSDLRATLPHVLTPTLVIAGQNDRITAPGASRALAEALPDARYVEMRRAAHTPFLSHLKDFAVVLARFLHAGEVEVAASDRIATHAVRSGGATATGVAPPKSQVGERAASGIAVAGQATRAPVGPVEKVPAGRSATAPTPSDGPVGGVAKKKKRMKARARKKLQASSR